jgi:hypothetical protein
MHCLLALKLLSFLHNLLSSATAGCQVPAAWSSFLAGIATAFEQVCGPQLVGVYLRGSLPQGHFITGVSDLDIFALVLDQAPSTASSSSSSSDSCHRTCSSCITDSSSNAHVAPSDAPATNNQDESSHPQLYRQLLQQQVQQLVQPLQQQHAALGFTKVGR